MARALPAVSPSMAPAGDFSRLLVEVDRSAASPTALDWALHRTLRSRVPLTIVATVAPDADPAAEEHYLTLLGTMSDRIRAAGWTRELRAEWLEGEREQALLELAGTNDLLVLASDARSVPDQLRLAAALGSPVALIGARAERARHGVVAVIDDVDDPERFAQLAGREADLRGEPLIIAHREGQHLIASASAARAIAALSAATSAAFPDVAVTSAARASLPTVTSAVKIASVVVASVRDGAGAAQARDTIARGAALLLVPAPA